MIFFSNNPRSLEKNMDTRKRFLFIHQNFPAQFKHLAAALAAQGHEVVALGIQSPKIDFPGVRYFAHRPAQKANAVPESSPRFLNEHYSKVIRGESAGASLHALKKSGFTPDIVFAHPGWGEAFFVKDIYPQTKLLIYAEYFYQAEGGDAYFDSEFTERNLAGLQNLRLKNTHLIHAMTAADAGLSPTIFQRDRHPHWFRDRISVIHDGIETDRFLPNPKAVVRLMSAGVTLRPTDEVITFAARELEPYRGYHIFMRALPDLLKLRPRARVVIVGGDNVSYGAAPPPDTTWKQTFLKEVADRVDMKRVHFVGKLPHHLLTELMQVSTVHTYLTYPFVLSWSLLEAMSIGCLIVASKTAPVEEVIENGRNGILVDFFNPSALAQTIADAVARRSELQPLRAAARQTIIDRYDLQRHCLPEQLRFVMA